MKEFLVIALYLWVVFGLFLLYKSVILAEEHIDFAAKALFTVVLACFKILEEAGVGLYRGESFQQSIASLGGGTLQGILILTLLLFVLLIPLFGFTELQRVLGERKLTQLFFHSRPLENQAS